MWISATLVVLGCLSVGLSAQGVLDALRNLRPRQDAYPSSSTTNPTASSEPKSCSCFLTGSERYHAFTGTVERESKTYYAVVQTYITPQGDGSYVTNKVTVTRDKKNSIVTGAISTSAAPTWVVSGATLTYPTTYVENFNLEAGVGTEGSTSTICEAAGSPNLMALNLPSNSATGVIVPVQTSVNLNNPTTIRWEPALIEYLDGLPALDAQFADVGGINFSSCKGAQEQAGVEQPPVLKISVAVLISSTATPITASGPASTPQSQAALSSTPASVPGNPQPGGNYPASASSGTTAGAGQSTPAGTQTVGVGSSGSAVSSAPAITGGAVGMDAARKKMYEFGVVLGGLLAVGVF